MKLREFFRNFLVGQMTVLQFSAVVFTISIVATLIIVGLFFSSAPKVEQNNFLIRAVIFPFATTTLSIVISFIFFLIDKHYSEDEEQENTEEGMAEETPKETTEGIKEESKPEPKGPWHIVWGEAHILKEASLTPHGTVTTRKEWAEFSKSMRGVETDRTIVEINDATIGNFLHDLIGYPFQHGKLCVMTGSMGGLLFDFMDVESYHKRYWN